VENLERWNFDGPEILRVNVMWIEINGVTTMDGRMWECTGINVS
jgi:hypothetical protein